MKNVTTGRGAGTERLRRRGFAPEEVARLVALKGRHDRGELREITVDDRLRFARYLVASGWLADEGPTRGRRDDPSVAELLGEIEALIARRRASAGVTGGVRTP